MLPAFAHAAVIGPRRVVPQQSLLCSVLPTAWQRGLEGKPLDLRSRTTDLIGHSVQRQDITRKPNAFETEDKP